MTPLIGRWRSEAAMATPASSTPCLRVFSRFGPSWVRLDAEWATGPDPYRETALFGLGEAGLEFWSFTSDGKRSRGSLVDASDLHAQAVGFQAEMPAGTARMTYWPDEDEGADSGGFYFAVESRTTKGWNRFVLHRYRAATP